VTIQDAVAGLKDLTEFKAVINFIKEQKESCLVDFMDYQHIDSPEKLARLSGEIAAFHRIITLLDEKDDDNSPSAV
jgi:hypothetical protein